MLVNFNGQFIPKEDAQIAINDCSLLYGDSLFETLRAEQNHILYVDQHLDRLCHSAKLLNFPCERSLLETALTQMAQALKHECSRLRLTLGRGCAQGFGFAPQSSGWFTLTATKGTQLFTTDREKGVDCVLAPNSRTNPLDHLPQLKRGNHADCLYAADYARKHQAREALFVEKGRIIEGSSSNIFVCLGEELYTPPLSKLVLAGITRHAIIKTAIEYGLSVKEEALPLKTLYAADEIWLTNSMIELLPVANINARAIQRGPLWQNIYQLYKQRTTDLTSEKICL